MKHLTYGILDNGLVISRMYGSDKDGIAWPIMEYEKIGQNGDFTGPIEYYLERINPFDLAGNDWNSILWTKKIPISIKNKHREFWGMKPLKEAQ